MGLITLTRYDHLRDTTWNFWYKINFPFIEYRVVFSGNLSFFLLINLRGLTKFWYCSLIRNPGISKKVYPSSQIFKKMFFKASSLCIWICFCLLVYCVVCLSLYFLKTYKKTRKWGIKSPTKLDLLCTLLV